MGKRKLDSELHRIKLDKGTVYQTQKGGNYYFRYQINGERKCISLKTANQEEALRKAKELLPTVRATDIEVIASHVKVARRLAAQTKPLPLSQIWEVYSNHPQRALPATVREQLSYEATLAEFLRFLGNRVSQFSQITEQHVMEFAKYWYCNGILDTFGWKFPNAVFSFKPRKSRSASLGVRIPNF